MSKKQQLVALLAAVLVIIVIVLAQVIPIERLLQRSNDDSSQDREDSSSTRTISLDRPTAAPSSTPGGSEEPSKPRPSPQLVTQPSPQLVTQPSPEPSQVADDELVSTTTTTTPSLPPTTVPAVPTSEPWTNDTNLCEDPWRVVDIIDADDCECVLPWQPVARDTNANWQRHHERLKEAASYFGDTTDVVWLGDSIVEFMNGTHLSASRNNGADRVVFRQAFGEIPTLAVGSASDTTNNLLYHLRNGVYAPLQGTKVWILTAGTNNLGLTQCSRGATLEGILSLVHFLKQGNASATVIVHGMLPRGGPRQPNKYFLGRYWEWIQDINSRLRDYCFQSGDCLYTQVNTTWFLTNSSPPRIRADTMKDAIHPDASGYQRWLPSVSAFVRSVLELDQV